MSEYLEDLGTSAGAFGWGMADGGLRLDEEERERELGERGYCGRRDSADNWGSSDTDGVK